MTTCTDRKTPSRASLAPLTAFWLAIVGCFMLAEPTRAQEDRVPPRVLSTSLPQDAGGASWAVGRGGLDRFQVVFSEAVLVPDGAVGLRGVNAGSIQVEIELDPSGTALTVTPLADTSADILTLIIDYTITDLAGRALDGETGEPLLPTIPTGDGRQGGQLVVRINALQGDVTRDGVVDTFDAMELVDGLGFGEGDPEFEPRADLNRDGFVNVLDVAILRDGMDGLLPTTDGTRPNVQSITPDPAAPLSADVAEVAIVFDEALSGGSLSPRSLFAVDLGGELTVASGVELSPDGRTATFAFDPPLPQCGQYTLGLSPAIADPTGELRAPAPAPVLKGSAPTPAPTIEPVATLTSETSIVLRGDAPFADRIEVASPAGVFAAPVLDGRYEVAVGLGLNRANRLDVVAISACGVRSAPTRVVVRQDQEPPEAFIDFPSDGAEIEAETTDVAGRVGDRIAGFDGLRVLVNGREAEVDIGIGTNGTFFLEALALSPNAPTEIVVEASDALGNTRERRITVQRVEIPPDAPQMAIAGGNAQQGPVRTILPEPISVRMLRGDGTPFVGKVVTFDVARSDGRLASSPNMDGSAMLQVLTDGAGIARAFWTLGSDAGCGNNRVAATSRDIAGTIVFCASAAPAQADRILVGDMNNQRAEAGGPLPEPLRVFVTDDTNGVAGVPVTFTVVEGDGVFADGQTQIVVETEATGHANAPFTLGATPGRNRVEATFENGNGVEVD